MKRFGLFIEKHYDSREQNAWAPTLVWWALLIASYFTLGWPGVAFVLVALLAGGWGCLWNALVRGKLVP